METDMKPIIILKGGFDHMYLITGIIDHMYLFTWNSSVRWDFGINS